MKKWKKELAEKLKAAYEAPEPQREEAFCERFGGGYLSTGRFFVTQIPYIKKWVWVVSTGIFGCGVLASLYLNANAVWVVASFAPILALTLLAENAKSSAYGMEELESATRFSLKTLLLARMGALAVVHGIVIAALVPLCAYGSALPALVGGVYILVPYFLTVLIGVALLRKAHKRGEMNICIGVSVLVSVATAAARGMFAFLYEQKNVKWWAVALAILAAAVIREGTLFFRQKEKTTWN